MSKASIVTRVGIITEDESDYAVIKQLTTKIARTRKFVLKKWLGKGAGRLKSKCSLWADNLIQQGCTLIIVMRDLDNKEIEHMETELNLALSNCKCKADKRIVVIAVQAIEAWLLCDEDAIQRAMNLKDKVTRIQNPESIRDPKRELGKIVFSKSRKTKRYHNTFHNEKIASEISIDKLRRCSSFVPLEKFLNENLK